MNDSICCCCDHYYYYYYYYYISYRFLLFGSSLSGMGDEIYYVVVIKGAEEKPDKGSESVKRLPAESVPCSG